MLAMLPQKFVVRVSHVSTSPPRLSIAPPHCASSSGREPRLSPSRNRTRVAPSFCRYSVAAFLPVERDDLVAAAREHVDRNAANAAGRARDDDFAAFRTLAVLFHAMNCERGGVARGADRHAPGIRPAPAGSEPPSRPARARTRRNRRRGSRTAAAVHQDFLPGLELRVLRRHDFAGEIDAADERILAQDLAGAGRRERVLKLIVE